MLIALGCGDRARAPGSGSDGAQRASADRGGVAHDGSSGDPEPRGPSDPADALRALRAEAARRCRSGSAQLSAAGEAGSRCTVERGCTETRGKVSASDGHLTLECRGLACTCTFAPRLVKANRKRVQFAIERPCGLSRGTRAESLWLEHCFPLLPPAAGAAPTE